MFRSTLYWITFCARVVITLLLRRSGVLLKLDGYGTRLPILVGAVDHGRNVFDEVETIRLCARSFV
ncbi:hypothetical protein COMA2_160009 [Candidatus Nitrospira nitrificans]|uniref:Uncharacterized protein n=1 Tax=Candidatus Nitrospira nitrificans TaxID=1742973 RepID=A0A0S4LG92_9BACT|nr:hypothetical protein COMA2_160009 [Candidatus Nitrospira nitrificans]